MSKGNTFENELMKLIFNAVDIANLADDAAVDPLTSLYVSLHTANPGEAGLQTTNEISYTGYARQAVARSAAGWTVTGNSVSPVNHVDFPEMTGGTGGTVNNWAVGTAASGDGKILYYGEVDPDIAVAIGVTPRIKNTSTITED